jgi:hypothetical protein
LSNDDPEIPAFNFDESLNPISAYRKEKLIDEEETFLTDEDFEEFEMP